MKLSLEKYKLIIFDWDGTLVDSVRSYLSWDKLYVQRFYGVELPDEYLEELARDLKELTPGVIESRYFRFLDETYGNGKTSAEKIWENVYSLAPEVQGMVTYQDGAVDFLKLLKQRTNAPITLGTNAELRDIQFYSSAASRTAAELPPLGFFDKIVTSDDINNPKPNPETFQLLMREYKVEPHEVLIFEDSKSGIEAGWLSGADVVAMFTTAEVAEKATYRATSWDELVPLLGTGVSH